MPEPQIPNVAGLSAVIPHFHYDLIGRIAPGMYLVLGWYWIVELGGKMPPVTATPSFVAIVIAAFFAYVLGFTIGPLSYFLFDRTCRFDAEFCVGDVRRAMDQKSWTPSTKDMKKADAHRHIVSLSEQSVYILWQRAPLLAIMTSRWDAEAFAARQFGVASIILAGITLWMLIAGRAGAHTLMSILVIVLAGTIFLCGRQFKISRKRAIRARFEMLISLPPDSPSGQQAAAAGR